MREVPEVEAYAPQVGAAVCRHSVDFVDFVVSFATLLTLSTLSTLSTLQEPRASLSGKAHLPSQCQLVDFVRALPNFVI